MTDEELATATAEAAAIAPLPSIFDAELADARRHCRYDSKAVMRASSETVADKAAYLEWVGDTQLTNHLGRLVWQLFPNASSRFAHVSAELTASGRAANFANSNCARVY